MDIDNEIRKEARHAIRNSLQTIIMAADDDPMYPQPLRDRLKIIREAAASAGGELRKVGL